MTEESEENASADHPAGQPRFSWSDDKNEQLKQERGISFEQVVQAFAAGQVLANLPHPNQIALSESAGVADRHWGL